MERTYPGRDVIVLRIEDAFDPAWWPSVAPSRNTSSATPDLPASSSSGPKHELSFDPTSSTSSTSRDRLTHFLSSLPTPSAKSSMISQLTRMLLLHAARSAKYNCSHLLMADSLSTIAASLISSVAEGGGFNLKAEWEERWVGDMKNPGVDVNTDSKNVESEKSAEEVMILKPLRDVTAKECGVFFQWRGMSSLVPNGLFKGDEDVDQGIRKLTRGALEFLISRRRGLTLVLISSPSHDWKTLSWVLIRTSRLL